MPDVSRLKSSLHANLAAPPVVAVVTWGLHWLQSLIEQHEGIAPRPYSLCFLIVIGAFTLWGGIGSGAFTLFLAACATLYFLVAPQFSWEIERPRDIAELVLLLLTGVPVLFAVGRFRHLRQRSADLLTQSEEAQAALSRTEEQFRFLAESIPQLTWTATAEGWNDYFNARWYQYTGLSREHTQGWQWSDLLHPDDRDRTIEHWRHCLKTGERYEIEYRFKSAQGEYRWFLGLALPQKDTEGRILRWFGTLTDIQAQKDAEAERDRLLEETRIRAEREALLNRIGQAQRVSDSPDFVQEIAVENLGKILGADRCYFTRFDLTRGRATIGRDWHREDLPSLAGVYRFSDFGIHPQALYPTNDALIIRDWETETLSPAAQNTFKTLGIRAGVMIPLFENDQLVATLGVAMTSKAREWTSEEVALVEAVTAQTRASVELALLRHRDHNIAERLQDALRPALPAALPGIDLDFHYEAALAESSIGGDFFDVFTIQSGCIAFVVGDLAGKGLDAAAQIATVRNMLRFALYRGRTIAEAITDLNDTLVQNNLLTGFATLFVGLYDQSQANLTYVSCGHDPALIRRAGSGHVEEFGPTGPVLGAFPGAVFHEEKPPLNAGDALFIYTDGLSEAGRERHEFLGVGGLKQIIETAPPSAGATAFVTLIVDRVREFAHCVIHDDQCLLAVIVEPDPA